MVEFFIKFFFPLSQVREDITTTSVLLTEEQIMRVSIYIYILPCEHEIPDHENHKLEEMRSPSHTVL